MNPKKFAPDCMVIVRASFLPFVAHVGSPCSNGPLEDRWEPSVYDTMEPNPNRPCAISSEPSTLVCFCLMLMLLGPCTGKPKGQLKPSWVPRLTHAHVNCRELERLHLRKNTCESLINFSKLCPSVVATPSYIKTLESFCCAQVGPKARPGRI